mmetsp:Transcript_3508/g.5836  ORF Transcript_3508/g.5836 Transcript_3508/m.5836 type:complete len:298 (-) Transcript_3508:35-928(-)
MDLLGGYGSGGSDAEDVPAKASAGKPVKPAVADGKKRIDYSKLPISRPLQVDALPPPKGTQKDKGDEESESEEEEDEQEDVEEPPLKKAADIEKARRTEGLSLLAALPQPKTSLGGSGGRVRLDMSSLREGRELPKAANPADILKPDGSFFRPDADGIAEELLPDSLMSHPMFNESKVTRDGRASGDGPTEEELSQIRGTKNFTAIKAEDMVDPDWYMQSKIHGGPPVAGTKVPEEMSMYESGKWSQTTHANPSRVQKRKHQINWLAQEAMEKEAEMLDRSANNRLTKAQTQMKYGW